MLKLLQCSIWNRDVPIAEYGITMYTIWRRIRPLLMRMEKRYGQLTIADFTHIMICLNLCDYLLSLDRSEDINFGGCSHGLKIIFKICWQKGSAEDELTEKEIIRAKGIIEQLVENLEKSRYVSISIVIVQHVLFN